MTFNHFIKRLPTGTKLYYFCYYDFYQIMTLLRHESSSRSKNDYDADDSLLQATLLTKFYFREYKYQLVVFQRKILRINT